MEEILMGIRRLRLELDPIHSPPSTADPKNWEIADWRWEMGGERKRQKREANPERRHPAGQRD
jgi:hypothetical protein